MPSEVEDGCKMWTCSTCTVKNIDQLTVCAACEAPKPNEDEWTMSKVDKVKAKKVSRHAATDGLHSDNASALTLYSRCARTPAHQHSLLHSHSHPYSRLHPHST